MFKKDIINKSWQNFKINNLTVESEDFLFGKSIKNCYGIYLVASEENYKTILGYSDIWYIGQGKLRDRLIALLDPYFKSHSSGTQRNHTAKNDLKRMIDVNCYSYSLYYKEFSDSEKSRQIEKKLLNDFCNKNIMAPPFNSNKN